MKLWPSLEIFSQLIYSSDQILVILSRLSEHLLKIFNFESFDEILILIFSHIVFQILNHSFVLNSLIEHPLL